MTTTVCVHRWEIEEPSGPTSTGECRRCGEVREFRNSNDFRAWHHYEHTKDGAPILDDGSVLKRRAH